MIPRTKEKKPILADIGLMTPGTEEKTNNTTYKFIIAMISGL